MAFQPSQRKCSKIVTGITAHSKETRKKDLREAHALFERHMDQLHNFLSSSIRQDPDRALDRLQETYVRLFEQVLRYGLAGKKRQQRRLLFKIARSVVVDEHRKQATQRKAMENLVSIEFTREQFGPLESSILAENRKVIKLTLLDLPKEECQAIQLRFGRADLSFQEIGKILGVTGPSARNYVERAKVKLRRAVVQGRTGSTKSK